MRLLLDTHCWLWFLIEPDALSEDVLALLRDERNEFYLSAATPWEITIKAARGKLTLPDDLLPSMFVQRLIDAGVRPLPITHDHALRVSALPDHHRDPFDRILMAQALVEPGMQLVTGDHEIRRYGDVPVLWARG